MHENTTNPAASHLDVTGATPEHRAELGAIPTVDITAEIDRRGVKTRASHCSCGRPAREILDGGEHGPTGYCGAPQPPLNPCDCGKGAELHDRSVCSVYGRGLARELVDASTASEDLGIEWTDEGMFVRRPAWCRTDEEWRAYRDELRIWWGGYWDGFVAARRVFEGRGA